MVDRHVEADDHIAEEENVDEDVVVNVFPVLPLLHEHQLERYHDRDDDLVEEDDRSVHQVHRAIRWKQARGLDLCHNVALDIGLLVLEDRLELGFICTRTRQQTTCNQSRL